MVAAVADETFPDSGLPVAEILVLAGFLLIYLVEELMHFMLVKYGNLGRSDWTVWSQSDSLNLTEDETAEKQNGGGHGHSHDNVLLPTEAGFQVLCGHWGHQPAIHYCKNILQFTFIRLPLEGFWSCWLCQFTICLKVFFNF